jgi:hypothetical protein
MVDLTDVKGLFGLVTFKVAVVFDAFSRMPLSLRQGLVGATPAEIYSGRTPSHLSALPPPRGRPGEGPADSPFRVEHLDAERLLPTLVRKAA